MPGKTVEQGSGAWAVASRWETQEELAPGVGMAQPLLLYHLGEQAIEN